jgi:outer membrane biosynthesis protein TonB
MSLAAAQQRSPRRDGPVAMPEGVARRGMALSGALHLVLIAVLIFGLPTLFSPPPPQEMPIAVDLVNIGPETRATRPNPNTPQHAAKPVEPIPGPTAVKPERKPEAPPSTAPASAAAMPTPEPPAWPEAKPIPTPTPPPPLPQEKPEPPLKTAEKVAAPRPQEKLESPKQTPEAARAEASKYDPGRFDALLRNLAAADNPPAPDEPPRKSVPAAGTPSSQPEAPLASRLSASEMDMVREQISRCWNVPAGARDAKDLVVEIRVVVNPDGNVQQATIVDQARVAEDPFFRAAAESARRAFFNPDCRPLRLPAGKYELWKDMIVDFSPKDLS